MKKIAVGEQELSTILGLNKMYVDKTKQILDVIDNQFIFLSRPRRFGKTLTIDTMKEMFLGNKELFKGLYAYDNYREWDKSYPVILISMGGLSYTDDKTLLNELKERTTVFTDNKVLLGKDYITWEFNDLAGLIDKLYEEIGKKVVVLIDEYDTPFTHSLDDKVKLEKVKYFFQSFYGRVKSIGSKIRFFYLSGLTKVAQASLFSTLNNLNDITFSRDNYDVIGYTIEEIKLYFKDYIENSLKELGLTEDELFKKLKDYYDGYYFGRLDDKLYNPWSINNFFFRKEFKYYWLETGGESLTNTIISSFPKYFSKLFKELDSDGTIQLETTTRNLEGLNEYTLPLLLLNAGYITFVDNQGNLGIANAETRYSLYNQYIKYLQNTNKLEKDYSLISTKLTNAIISGNANEIKNQLLAFKKLKDSPQEWMDKNPEGAMKESLFFILRLKGKNPKGELQNNNGRMDIYFEDNGYHYIIEYKVDGTLEEGMKQINDKYLNQFIHKKGYKIVINYKKKATKDFEVLVEKF